MDRCFFAIFCISGTSGRVRPDMDMNFFYFFMLFRIVEPDSGKRDRSGLIPKLKTAKYVRGSGLIIIYSERTRR